MLRLGLQFQPGVNAADHQDVILGFDFPHRLGNQPRIRGIDLTRFQRASKGAGESAGGGGHDVIEGRGVGVEDLLRHLVVLRHRAVHAENHRRRFRR